jgi:hypothetical protein
MHLLLNREYLKDKYTIGTLYIDGVYLCETIEDKVREKKVYGETAIPYGVYIVSLTMSYKFKRVLPLIQNVPNFTGIRIHRGNTADDSHGCILPGENKERGKVLYSTKYEMLIIEKMLEAVERGESITIEII